MKRGVDLGCIGVKIAKLAGTGQIPAVVVVDRPCGREVGTATAIADNTRIFHAVEVVHGDTGIGIIGQIRDVVAVIVFTTPLDGSALVVERDGPTVSVGVVDIEHDALCCSARSGESFAADNASVGTKDVADTDGLGKQ